MIKHTFGGRSICWRAASLDAPRNRSIDQCIFRGLLKHQVERCIYAVFGDLPDRQFASQLVPSQRLQADTVARVALSEAIVVDVAQLFQSLYAGLDQSRISAASPYQSVAQLTFTVGSPRQNLQGLGHHSVTRRRCGVSSPIIFAVVCGALVTLRGRTAASAAYLVTCSVPSKSQLTNCLVSGLEGSSAPVRLRDRSMSSRAGSETDLTPETLSRNSSAFVAPLRASSYVINPREYRSNNDWSKVCIPYCDVPCAIASRIIEVFSG